MSLIYLCPECCKKHDLEFFGMAENRAGRKSCSECGDSRPIELHILSRHELFQLAEKERRRR